MTQITNFGMCAEIMSNGIKSPNGMESAPYRAVEL
jgi:hypothetical protein